MRHNKFVSLVSAVLVLCAVLLGGTQYVRADFINTAVTANIPVDLVRADVSGTNTYEIVLEALDQNCPMPENNVISFTESGASEFSIAISEPGTYSYKIYERSGTNNDITYDDTVYTVILFVTSDDTGALSCNVILSKGSMVKPDKVCFVNSAARTISGLVSTGEARSRLAIYGAVIVAMGMILLALAVRKRKEASDGYQD